MSQSPATETERQLLAYFAGYIKPVVDGVGSGDWPVWIRPLVEDFGPVAVWEASLATHGYPATWVRGAAEAMKVEAFLRSSSSSSSQGE